VRHADRLKAVNQQGDIDKGLYSHVTILKDSKTGVKTVYKGKVKNGKTKMFNSLGDKRKGRSVKVFDLPHAMKESEVDAWINEKVRDSGSGVHQELFQT